MTLNDTTRAAFAEFYDGCLCQDCLGGLEDRPAAPGLLTFFVSRLKRKRS